jgi:hypothetical protein
MTGRNETIKKGKKYEVMVRKNNSLTPWRRVLLEKLPVAQLLDNLPAFYGTRRFINAFATARHLFLS